MAKREKEVVEIQTPEGPRGDGGAYIIATLAVLLAIVAWVIAAQAGNKANHALKAANDATGVARRAEQTANNSHPEAASQAAPTTGAGPNTTVPTAGSGNTTPNGNGH